MNFYKLLVDREYVPRRNFRHATSKKDLKIIASIFRNNIFRKILFSFAKLIPNKYQLSKSIKNRLFEYQNAPEILYNKYLIDFQKKYFLIDFSHETKKSVVTKPGEIISTKMILKNDMLFSFSIAILENLFLNSPEIINNDIELQICILNKNNNKLKEIKFQLPIDDKKHGLLRKSLDDNWIDLSVDLNEFVNQEIFLNLQVSITSHTFTMFNRFNSSKNYSKVNIPCFAIGNPTLSQKYCTKKKILYISGESLTDPFFIKKKYKNINFPNIESLAADSNRYDRSYSIGDSTLPTIMAFKTGLFPSQHGFGDYSMPVYEKNQSENIKTIANIVKEKEFFSKSITSYPRFDPLYGWALDFDSYYQSEYPFISDAPDASRIIRNFESEKEKNLFIFTHITRTHGPFLSGDNNQTPNLIKTEELDDAMKDNFLPLYISQMKVFDEQIGQLIDYLKRTNQYDDTMIILVGDHGVAMPPRWDFKKNTYAHYEEHVRVPLIIKSGSWSKNTAKNIHQPVTAQKIIFDEILSHNCLKVPKEYSCLPQYDKEFKELAISETVYHPDNNNYAIMIVSLEFKYWMITEVDWKNYKILSVIDEKLFKVNSNGIVDEKNDISKQENYKKNVLDFRNKACRFFYKSSEFRKNFPVSRFPNTLKIK